MHYTNYGYEWTSLLFPNAEAVNEALRAELKSWEGTRYAAGQQAKGMGVDCIRFVCAVLDKMYGTTTDVPRLPQDMAMHDRAGSVAVMRLICGMYPHEIVTDKVVLPGDVFMVGEHKGGPGHAIFVGPDRNTLWQAGSREVHKTGLAFQAGAQRVFRVYRMLHKDTWAR